MSAPTTVPLLLNGEEVLSPSSSTFPVESPVSHQLLWSCSSASPDQAAAAVQAASMAFPVWSKSRSAERRRVFLKAADLIAERSEELKLHMHQETGSPDAFCTFNVMTAAEQMRDAGGRCSAIMGSIPMTQDEGTAALVLKEPYGVVLGIAPWNAPYILGFRAVIYALAAGNTCVLKGSELSPRCFYNIGRILLDAGLPKGALNVIYTPRAESAAITTQLINSPAVRKVNFTGSSAVGSIIGSIAGRALKPCLMELGGKAAAIVLDDADLELAASQCAVGAFLHSGQICMSTERIIVQESVIDKFRPALQQAVAKFSPADALSPVLVQAAAVDRNRSLVADALSKGAKLLHGDHTVDEKHPETGLASGTRLRPLIVDGVTADMSLYSQESFGPSVSVISAASEEEAVRIANDSDFGLNGAVFTRDLARGLRVAKQLECGSIHINSMSVHDEANLPHGGTKHSGWGRFNGQWGIEEFLRLKTVTYKE
ncbi:unnamed protein product [Mycena citricolor]|uniref:Aldehyde dehydrogenase domain-containing protein n=1 Tax=Mycena citricolor TaxID=2018698 RepID=A0AAD2GU96_9AGAR|nr:unnamed protein product [Mycena citricolor]